MTRDDQRLVGVRTVIEGDGHVITGQPINGDELRSIRVQPRKCASIVVVAIHLHNAQIEVRTEELSNNRNLALA